MKALYSALRNIRRTPYQTIASFLVMILTFFLLLLFTISSFGSNRILGHLESLPVVLACFKNDTPIDDVKAVEAQLQGTGKIKQTKILTQDDALRIFKGRYGQDHSDITEYVQKEFFPPCLVINANRAEDLDSIAATLKSNSSVTDVGFLREETKKLLAWTQGIRIFGLVLTGYAIITSIFTVLIVIGMKIAAKREEIEILQLLGATPWYIRGPFLMEGIIYGVIGAVSAWLIILIPFLSIQAPLGKYFSGAAFENFSVFPNVPIFLAALLAIQVFIGILVGLIGSFISLWRYLRA